MYCWNGIYVCGVFRYEIVCDNYKGNRFNKGRNLLYFVLVFIDVLEF